MFYTTTEGPESWKSLLTEPEKHWKKDHSARALAYCWEEAAGFPESVRHVFKQSGFRLFHSIQFLLGIPEHKVYMPPVGGRPSQNDLFVLAKSGDELVSITIEGKVNESFDQPVTEWNRKDPSPGKTERLEFLIRILELDNKELSNIRYQLLHRTASAILEAERFCAPHATMLVHSFSQEHKWFEDYAAFAIHYGVKAQLNQMHYIGRISNKNLYIGWITGDKEYLNR